MADYKDQDGNIVSLLKLCSLEPEWARSRIEALTAEVSDRTDEVIALHETINWWRGRYNNIISTMSCVVDGEVVQVDDSSTEYPLSDGAKALLARIARQSTERGDVLAILAGGKGLEVDTFQTRNEAALDILSPASGRPGT